MTIPKEIKDIIDNAVKNGELTKQKRNLVVQMAMSMGVDKNDVYQYIDEAERVKAQKLHQRRTRQLPRLRTRCACIRRQNCFAYT